MRKVRVSVGSEKFPQIAWRWFVIRGPTPSEHPRAQPARPRQEYRDDDDDFTTTSVRLQYYTLRADPPVTTDFG